jgi:hypothetical protein
VAVFAAFLWLVALAAFYALTEDQPYIQEWIVTGGVAILGAAVLMTAAGSWKTKGLRLPSHKLLELYKTPAKIFEGLTVTTAAIFIAIFRRSILRGRMHHQPFRYGETDDGDDIGRRAIESYLVCVGPNTMLVAFEPDKDQILVHKVQ